MSEKRLLRIEVTKNGKIIVDYEETIRDGYSRKHRCWDDEEAAPAFYDAIKSLSIHAVSLCELPESYASRITVRAVKYTYQGDNEIMGAKMLVGMKLFHSEGAMSYWTPHKPSIPYEENAKEPYGDKALTEKCVEALWELDRQAQLYINNERAQIALDFGQAAESEEDKEELPEGFMDEEEFPTDDINDTEPVNAGNIVQFPPTAGGEYGTTVTL